METASIYGLKDPRDGSIRYIGKSEDPERRFKGHLTDKAYSPKTIWLDRLHAEGLQPELVIFDEVSADVWRRVEQRWITKGLALGWPLTNREASADDVGHYSLRSIRPYLSKELWLAFHDLQAWEKVAIGNAIAAVGMFFSEPEAIGIPDKPVTGLGFCMARHFAHLLVSQKAEGKDEEFGALLGAIDDMAARVDVLAAAQGW